MKIQPIISEKIPSAIPAVGSEMSVRRTPERKVLGDLGNTKPEPVSPTANLRLLTSLASNLKSAVDVANRSKSISKSGGTPVPASTESSKLLPRKQKSLGLLCDKFLTLYPLDKPDDSASKEISLDGTAKALGTEKRRIYDIINVLESLDMATKAGKNRYLWHGQRSLCSTLMKFKSLAIKMGLREQIQEIQRINRAYTGDNCDDFPGSSVDGSTIYEDVEEDPSSDAAIKEDKSLGAMCQKFVMLFLVSLKNGVINLDIAAKVLITDIDNRIVGSADGNVCSRFKTKVRRLYDIANVLTAIGLIKKIYMYDRTIRKPVFKYIGPDVECVDFDRETPLVEHCVSSADMMTPSKSYCFSETGIHVRSGSCPTASSDAVSSSTRSKDYGGASSDTPMTDKRKPRKRKLFVGDTTMFSRTNSSPSLETATSRSLESRLDDSILRVAEMELEKLNSSEESRPKACSKLFSRYNSDSCITKGEHGATRDRKSHAPETGLERNGEIVAENSCVKGQTPFLVVSKENLIADRANGSTRMLQRDVTPLRTQTNVAASDYATPIRTVVRRIESGTDLVSSSSAASSSSVRTLVPRKLVPINGNGVAASLDARKYSRVTRYRIEPKTHCAPKIISLTNFDPKKLIPIKRSDLRISLTPVSPIVLDNRGTTGFAILTKIPAPIVSPGDTFRAVKIGNTLQLVPMKSDEFASRDNATERETDGNIGDAS